MSSLLNQELIRAQQREIAGVAQHARHLTDLRTSRANRPPPAPSRARPVLVLAGTLMMLSMALLAGGALAASPSNVVPANGKVAGQGYGYYLQRTWQITWATPPSGVSPCRTLTVGRQQVALISAVGATKPGSYHYTCTEPAGRTIYVEQLSNECSTIAGDHNGFGTTPTHLEKCAHVLFKGAVATAALDGTPLNVKSLIAKTGAYPIHLAKHNISDSKVLSGTSAAYGYGLLLTGLLNGTQTVTVTGAVPAQNYHVKVTYTLHIQ